MSGPEAGWPRLNSRPVLCFGLVRLWPIAGAAAVKNVQVEEAGAVGVVRVELVASVIDGLEGEVEEALLFVEALERARQIPEPFHVLLGIGGAELSAGCP